MDAVKNLPAPLRYGIPAVLVLVIGLVAWLTMFQEEPPRELVKSQDHGLVDFAKTALTTNGISYHVVNDEKVFSLMVAEEDATEAAEVLARSGVKDTTGLAKAIECPAAPGFTATKAANERADNCADASSVQGMLLTAGAIAANVKVSQQANETLLGPEKSKNVVAQVFLPTNMEDEWNAEQAARAISRAVGTSMDRVSITDDKLQTLYDGTASAGTTVGSSGAAGGSLGCDDIAGATEIETKKAAVRSCYEGKIGDQLTELLGGSDRYVLTVEPTIQAAATTTNVVRNTPGPAQDRSTQSGGGSRVEDVSTPANVTETTRVNPAGAISAMRITATLDKNVVTADQELAVKRMLGTFVDPKRGDPAPVVTMAKFANGAGDKPKNEDLEAIKAAAEAKDDATTQTMMANAAPKAEMPKWAMALMAVMAIGMITAVLVLWRRSAAMTAERKRLEDSFRNEQRLFEDFAQQNPDHLARDLNALFGAPSAPEPSYRA